MSGPSDCRLVGRWRITGADRWDREHLDLVRPAMLTIERDGHGEIAFGALAADLDVEYGRNVVFFTWTGFDDMHPVAGDGSALLLDDGTLEIAFAHRDGDEATLEAARHPAIREASGRRSGSYSP